MVLPCTNCGNSLDIIKGTVVQCFACGTKNSHFECYDVFSGYVQEVLGYPKAIDQAEDNVEEDELRKRIKIIDEKFNQYLKEVNSIDSFVVVKIYSDIAEDLHKTSIDLSKRLGMLKILIDLYILPHIGGETAKKQYSEYSIVCKIYHLAVLGLRHTIESKNNFKVELSAEQYEKARWNFKNAAEFAKDVSKSKENMDFSKEIVLFESASEFCAILKDILNSNPAYYSDQFEQLIENLESVHSSKARYLKNQMKEIYDLANELPKILHELRKKTYLNSIDTEQEKILYHSEEIKEKLTNAKIWIQDINDRYHNLQKKVVKLHNGQLIPYLRDYRKEFQNRLTHTKEMYNDTISQILQTTLLDYTISVTDLLEEVQNGFTFIKLSPLEVIERIRYVKKDMLSLDDDLKEFLFEILDYAIPESLRSEHLHGIISSISDKHSSFDRLIYKYIKKIIDEFIEERDEKRYTIEEQRDKFNIEIRPLLENLIETSFTITNDQVPYPIFLELVMLSTQLKVDEEYKVFFIVENPSQQKLENVILNFFAPNSFKIRTRQYKLRKIKPGDILRIETRIVPNKPGVYYFMAMIQYKYSTEMFWMPSIKLKLKVLDTLDEAKQYDDDELLNDLYKKYGRTVNDEEIESEDEEDDEIKQKKPKSDDLLPDID
ncbi:MAG: hypothetical protein GF364_18475 [Candidatus Lokiarchaeota archaeon]|nr:hypothetical protein [Candidatus Lokiarchaeota archaeon]